MKNTAERAPHRVSVRMKMKWIAAFLFLIVPAAYAGSDSTNTFELDPHGDAAGYASKVEVIKERLIAQKETWIQFKREARSTRFSPVYTKYRAVSWRVVNGAFSDIIEVLEVGDPSPTILKIPRHTLFDSSSGPRKVSAFNNSRLQLEQMKALAKEAMSARNVVEILDYEENKFTRVRLISGRSTEELLTKYDPSNPEMTRQMRSTIDAAKRLYKTRRVPDLTAQNARYNSLNDWVVVDAGVPWIADLEPEAATYVKDLTVLEGLVGLKEEGLTDRLLEIKLDQGIAKLNGGEGNREAAKALRAGIEEIRIFREGKLPATKPSSPFGCFTPRKPPGVGGLLMWADFLGIYVTAKEMMSTAEGESPLSLIESSGDPGVVCSQITPRVGTIHCERLYSILWNIVRDPVLQCTYVHKAYPNGRQGAFEGSSVDACTVEFHNFALKLSTDQDKTNFSRMEDGKLVLRAATADQAKQVLQNHFSYRFNGGDDESGELVFPAGTKVY